jgi:hypothetical protein
VLGYTVQFLHFKPEMDGAAETEVDAQRERRQQLGEPDPFRPDAVPRGRQRKPNNPPPRREPERVIPR